MISVCLPTYYESSVCAYVINCMWHSLYDVCIHVVCGYAGTAHHWVVPNTTGVGTRLPLLSLRVTGRVVSWSAKLFVICCFPVLSEPGRTPGGCVVQGPACGDITLLVWPWGRFRDHSGWERPRPLGYGIWLCQGPPGWERPQQLRCDCILSGSTELVVI